MGPPARIWQKISFESPSISKSRICTNMANSLNSVPLVYLEKITTSYAHKPAVAL